MNRPAFALWATTGFIILLCAPWLLPTNKVYHQLAIGFFWLPSLIALGAVQQRAALQSREMLLYVVLSLWTYLVLLIEGGIDPVGKGKVVVYVALSLAGMVLVERNPRWRLESILLGSAVLAGVFALMSWVSFYLIDGTAFVTRLVPLGLWDSIIPAAHAIGAFAVLGFCLLGHRPAALWFKLLACVAVTGFALALSFSQTRGIWVALAVTLVAMTVIKRSRQGLFVIVALAVVAAVILVIDPILLLQRGVSYRPQLWAGGLALMQQHWLLGLGFAEYWLHIPDVADFKHPHNLFLDIGVRLGVPGLLLFLALWFAVAWRGLQHRAEPLGVALLALWIFSTVSLMTDGIGLWLKPNADWMITWVPVGLSMVLAYRSRRAEADPNG